MRLSTKRFVLTGVLAVLSTLTTAALGQVTMTDIGAANPTPGPNDTAQLSIAGDVKFPDNLNYYTDNGVNNNFYAGQTFWAQGPAGKIQD